ncbi:defensin-like protein [Arabidopsis thaliana]|uniref:Putative defensin-like protein 258 n=1 Tax=Arabidopsis thaliana TaxID=3702 RepID=DF258_ARATH|nr:defensin-like protein [Arabidopsis thaliana]Q2V3S7.1 RecName: Full=Putative defensin-like protein 258; Flags: Precursor [Arabidopsis thaliana]AEE76911.1 defensin-like protein [Arabidopsis thaliana]|eukprot:NP_001030760.1 defensin-like protein [Arabidopsis thaliana]
MINVSLKRSLLIFISVITSNIGSEARELTGAGKKLEVATRSSNYAGTARTLLQARPCQRDVDCNFQCPRIQGGQCNNHHGTCDCF